MNIWQVDQAILDCIDAETGEIIDQEKLNALQMEREEKVENVVRWIKDLKAEQDALKAAAKGMTERARICANKVEGLKSYLALALNGKMWTSADKVHKVGYRASEAVVFAPGFDMHGLPGCLKRETVVVEPDKTAIREQLKAGVVLEGVTLEKRQNVVIK